MRMSPKCVAKQYTHSSENAQMCDVIHFLMCFKRKLYHILILLMMITVACCSIINVPCINKCPNGMYLDASTGMCGTMMDSGADDILRLDPTDPNDSGEY